MKKLIYVLLVALFPLASAKGQTILIKQPRRDTTYIKSFYRKHLTVRAFESTKFNSFKFLDHGSKLIFKPNDHANLGLGFNYKFISLNFGVYIPDLDKNNDIYGKTRQLDLQTHVYAHKFIVDLYGQFYRGYYLSNSDAVIHNNPTDKVAIRPDIATRDIAIVAQYLFNDKRFSYNAAFYQNEIQKKSAGSFLVGGGIYYTRLSADSSLIPANTNYANFFNNYQFNRASNAAIGFNIGYAYTLIIMKHFFATAAMSGGTGVNFAAITSTATNNTANHLGYELNLTERFALGYNVDKYFVGFNYVRLITECNATEAGTAQQVNTGNFRFILARRFTLKKTLIPKSGLIGEE